VLHPRHFLLGKRCLPIYSVGPENEVKIRLYATARDNDLYEITANISPEGGGIIVDPSRCTENHLPSFRAPRRPKIAQNVNPFLVIINAEIKFKRYNNLNIPEEEKLPPRIDSLIEKTIELVNLIYEAEENYPPLEESADRATGSKRKRSGRSNSD
jgi:hypothetical protein